MEGEKGLGGKEGGEEIVPSAGASVHLRNKWVLCGRKVSGDLGVGSKLRGYNYSVRI